MNEMEGTKEEVLVDFVPVLSNQRAKSPMKNTRSIKMNVYIWDMDETLILLKSLLNGTYAEAFNGLKDVQKGIEIGKRWEDYILQVCDKFFFYEQIEDYNEPFLDALNEYDDGLDLSDYDFSKDCFSPPYDDPNKRKLAYRHRIIGEKYLQGLHNFLDQDMIKLWDELYHLTDSYTDGWLSSARAFLEQALMLHRGSTRLHSANDSTKSQNINVLVTSGSLIPSLVKCLLFRLDRLIEPGNVYSSWEVGKHQCFSWIKERYVNLSVRFCVIGDGIEECNAAQAMKWPFIRIDPHPSGSHRFPGLTMKTLDCYQEVVYGIHDHKREEEEE